MAQHRGNQRGGFWTSRAGIALIVLLAVGGYFLWTEHRAHVIGNLPLILLLGVCIGMHVFMHGGHSHHDDGGNGKGERDHDA